MSGRAWKCCVEASVLAAALWAAGCPKNDPMSQMKLLNSAVAFKVYVVTGGDPQLIGSTPAERAVMIPPYRWWYVEPQPPVDMEKVRKEVAAQAIAGVGLKDGTDADLDHLKGLKALQWLELPNTKVTDAGLVRIKGLTALQGLTLRGDAKVTDAGLVNLKGLTVLQRLDLQETPVTDAGMVHLKGLTALAYLNLGGTGVTDAGLEQLKGLTALHWLDMTGTKVTDAGVEQLRKALPNVSVRR